MHGLFSLNLSSTDGSRFIVLCRYCMFYKLEVYGSPASSKSIRAIFPTPFAQCVSLCLPITLILVLLTVFQFVIIIIFEFLHLMIKLEQVRSCFMDEQSGLVRCCPALGKMLEMTKAVTGFQRTECNFERSSTIKPLIMLEKLFLKGVH